MSFILDALKKSETDRQRQSGPSLFEVKVAEPRRRLPVWAVAIAVLLGINLIVVSWMLLRHPSSQPPPATPTAAATGTVSGGHVPEPSTAATSAAAMPPATSPAPAGPNPGGTGRAPGPAASASLSAAPASAPPADGPPAGEPGASQSTAGGDPSDYAPAVEPAGARGSDGTEGTTDGGLPLYQQIVGNAGLPSLHLDLHVFADRPKDRFVMINMHRLGEGDSLPSGVQVETIRPDGVVLTYHGTRFLLPRN
ncbi:MAG: general secretion pathway protein GspB [Steroidobacteraceae bacterium]